MKKTITLAAMTVAILCLVRCQQPTAKVDATRGALSPVPFPDVKIPGFHFPEDSNVINKWVEAEDTGAIAAHAWGIWAGLTMPTGDSIDGEELLVFETWNSPEDLQDSLEAAPTMKAGAGRARKGLHKPRQFAHAAHNARKFMMAMPMSAAKSVTVHHIPCDSPQFSSGVYGLAVTVAYDIPAAEHIIKNKLYDTSVLQGMLNAHQTDIPDFPNSAISIKPTYEIIPHSMAGGYAPLRIWTAPNYCDSGFGNSQWLKEIYISMTNSYSGTSKDTFNLRDFIHYTVKTAQIANLDSGNVPSQNTADTIAHVGDVAILVGMHVTTKEIKRWTWETYWWTPDPNNPPMPSSSFIFSKKPESIKGAPAHYAMATAYTFTFPNQPYTGGNKNGTSIITFNPFLEAVFGDAGTHKVFYADGIVIGKHGTVLNKVGCQTNCMSCHALAVFNPNTAIVAQVGNYIPDTYIDMVTDSNFKNNLKLDFLWSIQSNLIHK